MITLDIGPGKTGTSAVQTFLFSNREKLNELGFSYPMFDKSINHVGVSTRLAGFNGRYDEKDVQSFFKGVKDVSKNTNVILHSEHFGVFGSRPFHEYSSFDEAREVRRQNIAKLRSMIGTEEVRMLSYLRRQDEMLISNYAQMVRGNARLSVHWDQVRNWEVLLNYKAMLQDYLEILQPKELIIKPYRLESLYRNNIVADWLYSVGLPLEAFNLNLSADNYVNVTPPAEIIEILRMANHFGIRISKEGQRKLIGSIKSIGKHSKITQFIGQRERRQLLTDYEEVNVYLACHFGGDGDRFFYDGEADIPTHPQVSLEQKDILKILLSAMS